MRLISFLNKHCKKQIDQNAPQLCWRLVRAADDSDKQALRRPKINGDVKTPESLNYLAKTSAEQSHFQDVL